MLKETVSKFHCHGNDDIYNMTFCKEDKCPDLITCGIWSGYPVACKQWELIDRIHHNLTVTEVMETLQENFQISYNAAKMSIKRWRKKYGM